MKSDKNKRVIELYNKIAKKYTEVFFEDFSDKEFIDKFLNLLPKRANILDVACGPGNFTKYMMTRGYSVEGIDLSEEMIKTAKKMVPNGRFKIMDMRRLEYSDHVFDGVFAAYCLIHVPSEEISATISEFYRILKKDGLLFIAVHEGVGENFIDEPLQEGEKIFVKFFTESEIKSFLEDAGFSILSLTKREPISKEEFSVNKLFIIAQK